MLEPGAAEKEPAGHALQVTAALSATAAPSGQGVHSIVATRAANVPAKQSWHEPMNSPCCAPDGDRNDVPNGHPVQSVAPYARTKPAGQPKLQRPSGPTVMCSVHSRHTFPCRNAVLGHDTNLDDPAGTGRVTPLASSETRFWRSLFCIGMPGDVPPGENLSQATNRSIRRSLL